MDALDRIGFDRHEVPPGDSSFYRVRLRMTIDLSEITPDEGWIAAEQRWRAQSFGSVEAIALPRQRIEQRVGTPNFWDTPTTGRISRRSYSPGTGIQITVPDYGDLEFVLRLGGICFTSSISRSAAPRDADDFLLYVLYNIPRYKWDVTPPFDRAIRRFYGDWMGCIYPVVEIEEMHAVSGYDFD